MLRIKAGFRINKLGALVIVLPKEMVGNRYTPDYDKVAGRLILFKDRNGLLCYDNGSFSNIQIGVTQQCTKHLPKPYIRRSVDVPAHENATSGTLCIDLIAELITKHGHLKDLLELEPPTPANRLKECIDILNASDAVLRIDAAGVLYGKIVTTVEI